jgi:hypothetical protein
LLLACTLHAVFASGALAQAPAPLPAPPVPDAPTATAVLTGEGHPKGTVTSPWCGNHPCGGPVGGNGPLSYEVVAFTGPSLNVAGGSFNSRLQNGWKVGGSVRTLWFNEPGTAAWVLDLGMNYTYNRGTSGDDESLRLEVFTPRPRNNAGELLGPDALVVHNIRSLTRVTASFGIGRDIFFKGPGFVGGFEGTNGRFGVDAGGRWGTGHVDLVPFGTTDNNYLRRTGITHGVYAGMHLNWEVPMGSWIFTSGVRTEWEYMWTNMIPPHNGDIVSVNILLTAGVRF